MYYFSDIIITWFFSSDYENSAEILKILSFAIPLIYLGYLSTQSLVALDHNRIYLVIIVCGLILNVVLNVFMIKQYGAFGAAIATVITEAFIPVSCFIIIRKNIFSSSAIHER